MPDPSLSQTRTPRRSPGRNPRLRAGHLPAAPAGHGRRHRARVRGGGRCRRVCGGVLWSHAADVGRRSHKSAVSRETSAGHHRPAPVARPSPRLRPGSRRRSQGSSRTAAPLVRHGPAADGRGVRRAGRQRRGPRRRALLADPDLRFRAQLLRAHRAGEAAPVRPGPAARLLLRPPRPGPQRGGPVGADRRRRRPRGIPCTARGAEGRGRGGAGALADERLQPLAGRHRAPDDHPQSDGPGRRHPQSEARRAGLRRADLRAGAGRARLDGERLLRGRPPYPHAAGRLGEAVAHGAGGCHRAAQGRRRPALRR